MHQLHLKSQKIRNWNQVGKTVMFKLVHVLLWKISLVMSWSCPAWQLDEYFEF